MNEKSLSQVLKVIHPKISVKKILDFYDVKYIQKSDELFFSCIFHENYLGKQDKNPSMSINANKKLFNCFSCPAKGNIYSLIMQLEIQKGSKSFSYGKAIEKACEICSVEYHGLFKINKDEFSEDMSIDDLISPEETKVVEIFNDSVLKRFYLKRHNYFLYRGFEESTLKHFEMGFGLKGADKDRCVFPVRNIYGGLVGWTGRIVRDNVNPKWLHRPKDRFYSSLNLFNIDKAIDAIVKTGDVYIVESVGNCMRMYESGFPNCVALLGNKMSECQCELILQYASRVLLLYDNDDGGKTGIEIAINLLYDKDINVLIGVYDFGNNEKGNAYDIADVKPERIKNEILYVGIEEYFKLTKRDGMLEVLDVDIDLKKPKFINIDGKEVMLTERLEKSWKQPQMCLEDILYIKKLDNLFGISGMDM